MTSEGEKRSRFPDTHWSLVGRAAASDEVTRQQALGELLIAYLPGLQAFLVQTRCLAPDVADDLLHDFVADKILARKLVQHADQGKGKFRNFVLKALNNYVTTKLKREHATGAATLGMDEPALAALAACHDTDHFDKQWLQQVIRQALSLMETDCEARGRPDLWEIFYLRVVDPMLMGSEPAGYEDIVDRLGFETPRQAINLLASAKRCFARHLRTAVGRYVHEEALIDDEIADLREIASR